jgi:hypothetical protein
MYKVEEPSTENEFLKYKKLYDMHAALPAEFDPRSVKLFVISSVQEPDTWLGGWSQGLDLASKTFRILKESEDPQAKKILHMALNDTTTEIGHALRTKALSASNYYKIRHKEFQKISEKYAIYGMIFNPEMDYLCRKNLAEAWYFNYGGKSAVIYIMAQSALVEVDKGLMINRSIQR